MLGWAGARARERHTSAEPHLRAHLGAQRIDGDEALRGFQVPERSTVAGVETLRQRADAANRADAHAKSAMMLSARTSATTH
jgi:hypothetical protein